MSDEAIAEKNLTDQDSKVKITNVEVKVNQIEKKLVELMETKDKLENTKAVLKHYKVKSDHLTQLTRAKKDLSEQINDEKKRIEDDFLEDADYEQAKNDELTLKNKVKEQSSELRELMAKVNKDQDLSTYDYNIKQEPVKLQVERVVKVYINGKEAK